MKTRIGDIATTFPVTAQAHDTVGHALQVMVWCGIRHLPVMQGDVPVGVLSERDILRCYKELGTLEGERRPIGAVATRPAVTIDADHDVATATSVMLDHGVGSLLVVSEGRLQGVVTAHDLLANLSGPRTALASSH